MGTRLPTIRSSQLVGSRLPETIISNEVTIITKVMINGEKIKLLVVWNLETSKYLPMD